MTMYQPGLHLLQMHTMNDMHFVREKAAYGKKNYEPVTYCLVKIIHTGWPQKSKPLPNDQKSCSSLSLRLDLVVKLKY